MAKPRLKKSDYSHQVNVVWLAKHRFDYVCEKGVHRESSRYRLKREPLNPHDANAVAVFVNHLKVGYVPATQAANIAKKMDSGDVFSIIYSHSTRGQHYSAQHDNDYSDGYFRNLSITIYNESEIARAKGQEIDPELEESLQSTVYDPELQPATLSPSTGCGCDSINWRHDLLFHNSHHL